MPFGIEVGLGSGDLLDGDPAPTKKKGTAPQLSAHVYFGQFWPMSIVAKRLDG